MSTTTSADEIAAAIIEDLLTGQEPAQREMAEIVAMPAFIYLLQQQFAATSNEQRLTRAAALRDWCASQLRTPALLDLATKLAKETAVNP